jgi:hypothetical protein
MAQRIDLDEREQQVFEAVTRLETRGETATVSAAARESGLDTDEVEAALTTLTGVDLVRERRVELDDDATGSGREYSVRRS